MPQPGVGVGFWVRGVEPAGDIAWWLADGRARRAFWRQVARITAGVYESERRQGIGVDGRKLARLSPYTIKHRRSAMGPAVPTAPAFIPAYELSRTVAWLRADVTESGVWMRWKGAKWGQILWYHANGLVHGAPARDVIGISPRGIERVRAEAARWWEKNRVKAAQAGVSERATITPRRIGLTLPRAPGPPIVPRPATARPPGWGESVTTTYRGGHIEMLTRPLSRAERAEVTGTTGWRQFRTAPPPLRTPALATPKPPTPSHLATATGVWFTRSAASEMHGDQLVTVDLARLLADVAGQLEQGMRPGGVLPRVIDRGEIDAPRIGLDDAGRPVVIDGRHRLVELARRGLRWVVVAVRPADAARIRRAYQ